MRSSSIIIRRATLEDHNKILRLYKNVARQSGGIARVEDEISDQFIFDIIEKATCTGIIMVAFDEQQDIVTGCIHASKPAPRIFDHVLNDLTILVDPFYQNTGLGKALFSEFLSLIKKDRRDILRVELF